MSSVELQTKAKKLGKLLTNSLLPEQITQRILEVIPKMSVKEIDYLIIGLENMQQGVVKFADVVADFDQYAGDKISAKSDEIIDKIKKRTQQETLAIEDLLKKGADLTSQALKE